MAPRRLPPVTRPAHRATSRTAEIQYQPLPFPLAGISLQPVRGEAVSHSRLVAGCWRSCCVWHGVCVGDSLFGIHGWRAGGLFAHAEAHSPPVTPPAAVSIPQAPPPPIPVKRRRAHDSRRASAPIIPHPSVSQASHRPQTPPRPTSDAPPPAN